MNKNEKPKGDEYIVSLILWLFGIEICKVEFI